MPARNAYSALTPEVEYTRFTPNSIEEPTPVEDGYQQQTAEGKTSSFGKIKCLRGIHSFVQTNAGLLFVTASQASFSLVNLSVKKLNDIDPPIPTLELIFVRMVVTYLSALGYMFYAGIPDPVLGPKGVRLWLWFRGFSGFFGLFGMYYALKYLSLSDATVLTFLSPLCTGIAGSIFLGETFTRKHVLASIFSIFGVILIARPTFLFGDSTPNSGAEKGTPHERLLAVGVSMLGVLGATGAYIAIRAAGSRSHPLHSITSFSSQCVVVALVGLTVQKTTIVIPKDPIAFFELVIIGVFGFLAQLLLTMGLQRETASRGALAVYTQVIFSVILEVLFYQTLPSFLSVCGTAIILSVAMYVALTKEPAKSESEHVKLEDIYESEAEEGLLGGAIRTPRTSADENVPSVNHDSNMVASQSQLNEKTRE